MQPIDTAENNQLELYSYDDLEAERDRVAVMIHSLATNDPARDLTNYFDREAILDYLLR